MMMVKTASRRGDDLDGIKKRENGGEYH